MNGNWLAGGRLDGCMHGVDGWIDPHCGYRWMGGWNDGGKHACMDGPIYMVGGWMDMDGWMRTVDLRGGRMDGYRLARGIY